ncbi:MAG: histidinol-phosphate transaminase, partial [Nitrospinota bacterium]
MGVNVPDHIKNLKVYEPGKPVEELERELGLKNTIKLASNENSLGPSPLASKAVLEEVGGLSRYPDGGGFFLKQRISRFHGVSPENILLGNGSNEILEIAARTFFTRGDNGVMADHSFVVYGLVTLASGALPVKVPLRGFSHDLDRMARAVDGATRIVFIANPDNPTGTSAGKEEFESFLSRVPESVLVILDEAYAGYEERDDLPDSISLLKKTKNLLVLRTFSKIHGLAGLRIGYGVASEELVANMNRVRQPFNTNSLAQVAASAALTDTEHLKKSFESNRDGKRYLCARFKSLGLSYVPSEANFILVEVQKGRQ